MKIKLYETFQELANHLVSDMVCICLCVCGWTGRSVGNKSCFHSPGTSVAIYNTVDIPYSGLFSWVEIFVKSWKRLSELNYVVLNFVTRIQRNVNFELGTRDAVSMKNV